MARKISHTDACFSESRHADRRARLYDAAYKAGLGQAAADDWVRGQLHKRRRGREQTPALFGTWLAQQHRAQKGQVPS